ncbi:hypothetical protein Mapa_009426 [Marchantia paleacea]|nr:hypothetical protein Mapa_009426 [Marchantia paleacea]
MRQCTNWTGRAVGMAPLQRGWKEGSHGRGCQGLNPYFGGPFCQFMSCPILKGKSASGGQHARANRHPRRVRLDCFGTAGCKYIPLQSGRGVMPAALRLKAHWQK